MTTLEVVNLDNSVLCYLKIVSFQTTFLLLLILMINNLILILMMNFNFNDLIINY